MASSSSSDAVKQSQKCALRVSVDCEGCRKKVTKIVNSIDGVESCEVDIKQQKVVVTGNIDVGLLLKTLAKKTGKHAELWPQDQKIHKTKKKKKAVVRAEDEEVQPGQENMAEEQRVSNCEEELKRNSETGQREENKAETVLDAPPSSTVKAEEGEKKKSKGQNGNKMIHIRVESPPLDPNENLHSSPPISNIPPRQHHQVGSHTISTKPTPNHIPTRHPDMYTSFSATNTTDTTSARYGQQQHSQVNGQNSSQPPLPNHIPPPHPNPSTSLPASNCTATTSIRYSQPQPVYTMSYSAAPQVQHLHISDPPRHPCPRPSYYYPAAYTVSYNVAQRPQTSAAYGYRDSVGYSPRPYRSYDDEVDYDDYGYRQQMHQQPESFGMFSDENSNACSIV